MGVAEAVDPVVQAERDRLRFADAVAWQAYASAALRGGSISRRRDAFAYAMATMATLMQFERSHGLAP